MGIKRLVKIFKMKYVNKLKIVKGALARMDYNKLFKVKLLTGYSVPLLMITLAKYY